MRIDLGRDEELEIRLIAPIDCIFFLLIFFMVATSSKQQDVKKREKDNPIVLPTSSATPVKAEAALQAPLLLTIDAQGSAYIDKAKLTLQMLHDRLRDEAAKNPNRAIRLDGDRHTPSQHLVHVLDLCQFEGLTQVSLHTRRVPPATRWSAPRT